MSNLREQLEASLHDLGNKKARAKHLNMQIAELGEDLKAVKSEYESLIGDNWGHNYGEIRQVEASIKDLQLKISHESKLKVVWVNEPSKYSSKKDQIVHKVTAKRIYVCTPDHTYCEMYEKDGTSVSRRGNKIDIEATFGGPCPEVLK